MIGMWLQAGVDRHRRAAAAWAVRQWLHITSIRAALLAGPLPHWWPLLHLAIISVALLSRLCHLSGSRPAVGAPSANSDCAQVTSDVAAAAVVLNIAPVALALRALNLWPWRSMGPLELPSARRPSLRALRGRGGDHGRPPALVLRRRRRLPDPPALRSVQDARNGHDGASLSSLTDPETATDPTSAHLALALALLSACIPSPCIQCYALCLF